MSTINRHVVQFRLGCLELERSRRLFERAAFVRRLGAIDQRLSEIEVEMAAADVFLGKLPFGAPVAPKGRPSGIEIEAGGRHDSRKRRVVRYGNSPLSDSISAASVDGSQTVRPPPLDRRSSQEVSS
jgi:hypothetical protein